MLAFGVKVDRLTTLLVSVTVIGENCVVVCVLVIGMLTEESCVVVFVFTIGKATEPIATPTSSMIIATPNIARIDVRLLGFIFHLIFHRFLMLPSN